jgi:hypothetical protein
MASISLTKIAALLLALPLVACGPSAEEDRAKAGPIYGPFVVSEFFTPSGLMGDGAIPGRLTVDINKNCREPRPPGAQGDCYRFVYKPGDVKWAGAFWVTPANNWGTAPGRQVYGPVDLGVPNPDVPGSPNLLGYHYARFSHSIFGIRPGSSQLEVLQNPQVARFWVGGLNGRESTPPQPYFDVGCSMRTTGPRCTDTNLVPPAPNFFKPPYQEIPITGDVQQYQFDLSRWSPQQVIGGFGFSLNADPQIDTMTMQPIYSTLVIYLDDIVWE